jgi:hypothetical protein
MRNVTLSDIFDILPVDLQTYIKNVDKVTLAEANQSTEYATTSDKLFLFSRKELNSGTTTAGYENEGEVYEYWSLSLPASLDRVKKLNGVYTNWWLRTPATGYDFCFCSISTTGGVVMASDLGQRGVCFGFCV